MGRRSLLGLLGATPLVAGGVHAASAAASATGRPAAAAPATSRPGRVPASLRPGGDFDRFLADLAAQDRFSGTVLLLHRDRAVLSRSYGLADTGRSLPNGPDTLFAVGSITKIFTALAIGQLAQQGRISFHATLGTYLDGFPAEVADRVTIHQMLTHTSGMGDFMSSPAFQEQARTWTTPEQVMNGALEFLRTAPLRFTPGTRGEYSNSGYHTLGAIVAAVSGLSYHDYIRRHIFAPAGMTSADFFTKPQWHEDPRIAHPYTTQRQPDGRRVDAIDDYHTYIGTPAGNSFASAPDLAAFKRALLGHRLLNPTYTELMLTPKTPRLPLAPPPGKPAVIPFDAYATTYDIMNGRRIVGHNGQAPGVFANLDWFPDNDWTAILLTNRDRDQSGVDTRLRELITGQ
jgi:CubicO group peptidase (beta-lactamase class C family)